MDLPVWQALYERLKDRNFTIIAVAMDSRDGDPLPWVEQAAPTYPVLVDRDHRLADLYNMTNVPQAVWIDERGAIVRPAENAGAYEAFRARDPKTGAPSESAMATLKDAKQTYVEAIADWVAKGPASEHVFDRDQALAHLGRPNGDTALAHAHFRLAQHLIRLGRTEEADAHLAEAKRLHPESWNILRQAIPPNDMGLAVDPDFIARVQALGRKHYYPPVDMKGMPKGDPPTAE